MVKLLEKETMLHTLAFQGEVLYISFQNTIFFPLLQLNESIKKRRYKNKSRNSTLIDNFVIVNYLQNLLANKHVALRPMKNALKET